jgi:tetratricopeptide (TPR) repeat protein
MAIRVSSLRAERTRYAPMQNDGDDDFHSELSRVLASVTFSKAASQRDLLRWLVDHAVGRDSRAFTQYAIGTSALGYPPSFDPATDSKVRIAIGRLRERLDEYYASEGPLNRFRISIKRDQYEPTLDENDDLHASRPSPATTHLSPGKLAVLVLPFLPIGFHDKTGFAGQLTLNLMRALAASGQARVVPWTTAQWVVARTGDKREYHRATGADVILEGLVQQLSRTAFRVTVQWIDGLTGLFDTFHQAQGSYGDVLALSSDLAGQLSRRLQITYDDRNQLQLKIRHSTDAAAALFYLKARESALSYTPHSIGRALSLVDQALRRDPYFAAAYALKAETNLAAGDAGMAPATEHAPAARTAAQHALTLAPELGEASAACGAVELTYDWDFLQAEHTLDVACRDPLADGAPHWPPILDLARGHVEHAAIEFEKWARLDPGSGHKAGMACEFWHLARRFDLAIRWGERSIEMSPDNFRAGVLLADSYMEFGRPDDSLRIGQRMVDVAPDVAETNLVMVTLLAKAGRHSDARQAFKSWDHRREGRYEWPLLRTIACAWLGETSLALEAMQQTIEGRHTVCLFARYAPYLAPLHHLPQFNRMLSDAGLPPADD